SVGVRLQRVRPGRRSAGRPGNDVAPAHVCATAPADASGDRPAPVGSGAPLLGHASGLAGAPAGDDAPTREWPPAPGETRSVRWHAQPAADLRLGVGWSGWLAGAARPDRHAGARTHS